MGFEPTIKTESFGGTDKSWIRTRDGLWRMKPIMLDMSTFNANNVVDGKIPSGISLGRIGTTDFYGPYSGATRESASIAVDATGGTFTITFRGTATAAIAFNATAAAVQAALELNPEIDVGDVIVTGGPGAAGGATPYVITFGGQYDGQDVAGAFTTGVGSLTGGAGTAAVTTTAGTQGSSDGRQYHAGHLFEDAKVSHSPGVTPNVATAADQAAALYWTGDVLRSKLPVFSGTNIGEIDDVAVTRQAGKIEYW